ncbi:MAG: metalloregulator ArsR/SmtB family transcription factor [Marinobacter sp.]|uniref:ArsR/SmtB family transcription factor n=1 Tax=Marinobacter sp. TaxID=50741 RepID=UPI00299EAE13|nr:metalloregulator ArsR/SmtB family transcription factor [Marinobacter sp.]MDX1634354.1 metalloregulator ArsR/SmtB family transcription factor [Marinobacter sp.]
MTKEHVLVDPERMQDSADEASQFLRSVANRDRLLLLCQLTRGELGVSDLESLTGIRQPSLSQQLGVLRRQGLIQPRREGKQVHYRIHDARALALLNKLYELFCEQGAKSEPAT